MCPTDIETVTLAVVRHLFLAAHIASVLYVDTTVELVALDIPRLGIYSPRTLGIYIACNLQIQIIVDSPIVAYTAHIQASVIFVAELRHDQSRRIRLVEREESERHSQRQRHIAYYQIRRTCGYMVARANLGFRHPQVEVRVFMVVASRVFAARHHQFLITQFLGLIGDDISFALLRHNVADKSFLRLDVVCYLAGFVTVIAVLEHRFADPFVCKRVIYAYCIDRRAVGFHTDIFGIQFHCLVVDYALTVQERCSVAKHDARLL